MSALDENLMSDLRTQFTVFDPTIHFMLINVVKTFALCLFLTQVGFLSRKPEFESYNSQFDRNKWRRFKHAVPL